MEITSTSITEGQPIELTYAHADAGGKNVSPCLLYTSDAADEQCMV